MSCPPADIELGPAVHSAPSEQRQILSLSGGGYRGLYTVRVLEALEAKARRPLTEVFDVIAGTSVGGLIAVALALGTPATSIRQAIETHGPLIFDRRVRIGQWRLRVSNPFKALYRAKYSQGPLRKAINGMLPQDGARRFDAIDKPVVIAAVDAQSGIPHLIRSAGLAGTSASTFTVLDALLATSAAPTFFPSHRIQDRTYVDGGLIANAPDLIAVSETVKHLGSALNELRVLSVGTAGVPYKIDRARRAPGLLPWLMARGLVQLTLSAQETLAVEQCQVLLGERYLRIDHLSEAADRRTLTLDNASSKARGALERAAKCSIDALHTQHRATIRRILSHQASERHRPLGITAPD